MKPVLGKILIPNVTRQGVLPWPRFWASTRPFGTPLGPYFVKWLLTIILILAPPAGDAFNFSMLQTRWSNIQLGFVHMSFRLISASSSHRSASIPCGRLWPVAVHRPVPCPLASQPIELTSANISCLECRRHFYHSPQCLSPGHAMVSPGRWAVCWRRLILVRNIRCDGHWHVSCPLYEFMALCFVGGFLTDTASAGVLWGVAYTTGCGYGQYRGCAVTESARKSWSWRVAPKAIT